MSAGSIQTRALLNGSTAIALAALQAGCDFFAGYPITPASEILIHMIRELPKVGGVAIQAEDEIAAMGFCIGAALAGRRVLTATSGPGLSLYSENIGAAIMGEVPLVIVDVQRMGPATGGATTAAQGDVMFLRWGTSGGYPVIVLSPASAAECFSLTLRAFDLAERFRLPVFLATDKEIAQTLTTVPTAELSGPPVLPSSPAPLERGCAPYHTAAHNEPPPMALLGGPHLVRFTTSTHDEYGLLTKNPAAVEALNRRLAEKVDAHADEISLVWENLEAGADTLLVSYGVTAQAARRAAAQARRQGRRVSELVIQSLWPVPESAVRRALSGVKRVIVPELNLGQYVREIERLADRWVEVTSITRVDGRLITPAQILQKILPPDAALLTEEACQHG